MSQVYDERRLYIVSIYTKKMDRIEHHAHIRALEMERWRRCGVCVGEGLPADQ